MLLIDDRRDARDDSQLALPLDSQTVPEGLFSLAVCNLAKLADNLAPSFAMRGENPSRSRTEASAALGSTAPRRQERRSVL
jgi:hypothetical protein